MSLKSPWAARCWSVSVAVALRDGSERLLGIPWHLRVVCAEPVLIPRCARVSHGEAPRPRWAEPASIAPHEAIARHVEVVLRIVTERSEWGNEGHHEGPVNSQVIEDGEHVDQFLCLFRLIAHEITLQPRRFLIVIDNSPTHTAGLSSASIGAATELRDHDRSIVSKEAP